MRITSYINDQFIKFEDRKINFLRKEMQEAYNKSAVFVDSSKKLTIQQIVDLLQFEGNLQKRLLQNSDLTRNQVEMEVASTREYDDENFSIENNRIRKIESSNLPFDVEGGLQGSVGEQIKPIVFSDIRSNIQEPFSMGYSQRNIERNILAISGDSILVRSTYEKAISHYMNQMKMAQSGLHMTPSQFLWIA